MATKKKKVCSQTTYGIQDLIIQEMNAQGLSARKMAELTGCSAMTITNWKKHQRDITVSMADRALKVLGIAVTIGKE